VAPPEEKKDLTGIFSLPAEDGGSASADGAHSDASDFPITPPETISEFESLDQFASHETAAEATSAPADESPSETLATYDSELALPTPEAVDFVTEPSPIVPRDSQDHQDEIKFSEEPMIPVESMDAVEPLTAEPAPAPAAPIAEPTQSMEKIRRFSENASVVSSNVPAAYPFSLLIEGELNAHEREKLVDVLSREKMGIREVDLEPQFASHRVLIPRISEYAGILLVSALRGAQARLKLGPSDEIYAGSDTAINPPSAPGPNQSRVYSNENTHPAETLPVTPDSTLPGFPQVEVIDTITASAALRLQAVETEKSAEYQEILDALQRELKYKAYRKGAVGIVKFTIHLAPLTLPARYRLMVQGCAVRKSV
jgi:hypothetical protein